MENYTIAWLMYLFGSLGLTAVVWRITLKLRREWRFMLVATVLALLFTPALLVPEQDFWAPAFLILLLDSVFQEDAKAGQAALMLVIGWLLALLIALVVLLLWRPARPSQNTSDA